MKKLPELDFTPQANMLHLLKSAKEITTLGVTSPKRPVTSILPHNPGIMDLMGGKGNNLAPKDVLYNNTNPMLVNRLKEPLTNSLLPGQRALPQVDAQGGSSGTGGSGDSAIVPASKTRALWKKSVETLKQTQPPNEDSPPSASVFEPLAAMKSQRFLPEEMPEVSDLPASNRPDLQKQHKVKETLRKRSRLPRDLSDVELSTLHSQASQQSNHSGQLFSSGSQGGQIYTIDSVDQEHGMHYPDIFSEHRDNKHHPPPSSEQQQPIIQLNSNTLPPTHEPDLMQNPKEKKYNTYGKPGGGGISHVGSGAIPDQRQTHCRGCLSKFSNYSGLYTMRPPQYRCDAHLYDISEDQLLLPSTGHVRGGSVDRSFCAFLPHPNTSFTAYLPQSDQDGDGIITHYQTENIHRQHSYENLPQRNSTRRVSLQDSAPYATTISDKLPKSHSAHLNHTLAGVGLGVELGIGRRSKSMYPARPAENPFLQTLRDDQRLAHGRSATDIYKQLVPLTLNPVGDGKGPGMPVALSPDIYYPEQIMPYVAPLPLPSYPAPRAMSAGGARRVYKRMPSIESDV